MLSNLEAFLKAANTQLELMTEYSAATDRLSEIDLQADKDDEDALGFIIDDIEAVIQEREELRERMETAQAALIAEIGEQSEDDSALIRCTFEGTQVEYSVSGDRSLARDVIYKLLAMQRDIIEKDTSVMSRLEAKHDEIRAALRDLQG